MARRPFRSIQLGRPAWGRSGALHISYVLLQHAYMHGGMGQDTNRSKWHDDPAKSSIHMWNFWASRYACFGFGKILDCQVLVESPVDQSSVHARSFSCSVQCEKAKAGNMQRRWWPIDRVGSIFLVQAKKGQGMLKGDKWVRPESRVDFCILWYLWSFLTFHHMRYVLSMIGCSSHFSLHLFLFLKVFFLGVGEVLKSL